MEGKKGAVLLKFHHSLGDGLALVSFLMVLCDKYDTANIPLMKCMPWFQKLFIKLASPFFILKEIGPLIFPRTDYNAICNGRKLTGRKKGSFRYLNFDAMKAASKKYNCTINDFVSSLIAVSLHDYFHKMKEDPDYKEFPIPREV